MSKKILEQVLEHILNKEEDKAQDLLHSFFVEKGRSIYEGLIEDDQVDEDEVLETEEINGNTEDDFENDINAAKEDIASEEMFSEEGDDEEFGDELGDEDDMDMDDMDDEEGGETINQVDDAVMDVEDALDELKSLFAQLKDENGAGDDMGNDLGDDMDMGPEEETEESFQFEDADELDESADLIAVAKPAGGDNGNNTRSPVPANSGAKGMSAKPVRLGSSESSNGGTGANAKDMSVNPGNAPGQKKAPSLSAVAKPAKAEAAGNTRSPVAGR